MISPIRPIPPLRNQFKAGINADRRPSRRFQALMRISAWNNGDMRGWFDLVSGCCPGTKPPTCRRFAKKRLKGFEPSTFCMASRRSSQLSYSRTGRDSSLPVPSPAWRVEIKARARSATAMSAGHWAASPSQRLRHQQRGAPRAACAPTPPLSTCACSLPPPAPPASSIRRPGDGCWSWESTPSQRMRGERTTASAAGDLLFRLFDFSFQLLGLGSELPFLTASCRRGLGLVGPAASRENPATPHSNDEQEGQH